MRSSPRAPALPPGSARKPGPPPCTRRFRPRSTGRYASHGVRWGPASDPAAWGLSYAPPGVFDDLANLAYRTLDVVIRHHVLVLRRVCHLAPRDLPPGSQVLRRLAASLHLTPLQLLLRRRDDEDEHRVRHQPAHLLRALDIDLQHDVAALAAGALDAVAECAVQVAVVGCVLEEGARRNQRLELLPRQKGVVLIGPFAGSRWPRGP